MWFLLFTWIAITSGMDCGPVDGVAFMSCRPLQCTYPTAQLHFFWCNHDTALPGCTDRSYVAMTSSDGATCVRQYTEWTTGMDYDANTQSVSFIVTTTDAVPRTANVRVVCDAAGVVDTSTCGAPYEEVGAVLSVVVSSKNACGPYTPLDGSFQITWGFYFCVLFGVCVSLYVVVGTVVTHGVKGVAWGESFPQAEFWKDFFSNVRDGNVFFFQSMVGMCTSVKHKVNEYRGIQN